MGRALRPGLFAEASRLLAEADPARKCAGVAALAEAEREGRTRFDPGSPVPDVHRPGRPDRPLRVSPERVPRRRLGSREGRVALVHAIAHIEFNAINLALDAVCRFRGMPRGYYCDWISVAADEARHFAMLEERLAALGGAYGDLPAHDGLWDMACDTADDCVVRMALVPRVLEARGLDVTPGMITRLAAAGDEETVAVLQVILYEEVRHVAIGTRWFRHCCEERGLDAESTFRELLRTRYRGTVRGPLNLPARRAAGFSGSELDWLQGSA